MSETSSNDAAAQFTSSLFASLKPAVEAIDSNVKNVFDSQTLLQQQLDALSATLEEFRILKDLPPLAPYTEKLQLTQRKLHSQSNDLTVINKRIEGIRTLIQRRLQLQQQQTTTPPGPAPGPGPLPSATRPRGDSEAKSAAAVPATPQQQPQQQTKEDTQPQSSSQAASEDAGASNSSTGDATAGAPCRAEQDHATNRSRSGSTSSVGAEGDKPQTPTRVTTVTDKQRLKELLAWDQ